MNKQSVQKIISEYAKVYKEFEKLQVGEKPILTSGDHKTGVIAEYYAKCYVEQFIKNAKNIVYGTTGGSHDIEYQEGKKTIKIQVKGVSAHSKTRVIAPLNLKDKEGNNAFDFLYLIDLDLDFKPKAFYINSFKQILDNSTQKNIENGRIQGLQMRGMNKNGEIINGSKIFDFTNDKCQELKIAINK